MELKYTKEQPTIPGWYFRRTTWDDGRLIVEIGQVMKCNWNDDLWWILDSDQDPIKNLNCEWAGPIQEPK